MLELDYRSFPVLVVDDEQDNLDAFRFAFRKSFDLHYATGGAEALRVLDEVNPAVIVTDQRMPHMSGVELLRQAVSRKPDLSGVLLTAYTDLPVLLEAINSGAVYRYMQKPWDSKELQVVLRQAIERGSAARENRRMRDKLRQYAGYLEGEHRDPLNFGELGVSSPAMQSALAKADYLAGEGHPVWIHGELGTETQLLAWAVHVSSPREKGPFVELSYPTLGEEGLVRSLFSPTGPGPKWELAEGGTLVISDLVRCSEELARRLGPLARFSRSSSLPEREVRLVVTSRSPPASVLPRANPAWPNSAVIEVPPLRDRASDVAELAHRMLRKFALYYGMEDAHWGEGALPALAEYGWPGNLRELSLVVERALLLAKGGAVGPSHVALVHRRDEGSHPSNSDPSRPSLSTQLDDIERRELLAALDRCGGNKAEVARLLGIQRTTLYYRLKRLGLDSV